MKSLLFVLLALLPLTSFAQETHFAPEADTLKKIAYRGKFYRSIYEYKYGINKIRSPRRLRPYFQASGDSLAMEYFEKGLKKRTAANWVGITGGVVAGVGLLVFAYGAADGIFRTAPSQYVAPGVLLMGVGLGSTITGEVFQRRSRGLMKSAIDRYNQDRQRRISWQLAPTGTGLRLVGRF